MNGSRSPIDDASPLEDKDESCSTVHKDTRVIPTGEASEQKFHCGCSAIGDWLVEPSNGNVVWIIITALACAAVQLSLRYNTDWENKLPIWRQYSIREATLQVMNTTLGMCAFSLHPGVFLDTCYLCCAQHKLVKRHPSYTQGVGHVAGILCLYSLGILVQYAACFLMWTVREENRPEGLLAVFTPIFVASILVAKAWELARNETSETSEEEEPTSKIAKLGNWLVRWRHMMLVSMALVVVICGALLFFAMINVLKLKNETEKIAFIEVNSQILNAVFTILALSNQPARILDTFYFFANAVRRLHKRHAWYQPESFPEQRRQLATVLLLLQLNCIFQYLMDLAMWGWPHPSRPTWMVYLFLPLGMLTGMLAGILEGRYAKAHVEPAHAENPPTIVQEMP
eukprot:TRINITY_DN14887_c0_g1_i1.p1 TRINITY_DN14887_c0_g1~~TRINITY_DN14887_c0_g1_i1.p1  ORF type:complete len:413 (+),score=64.94 TRINITY_DN14887_c0_g1_i1:44-1240(+)